MSSVELESATRPGPLGAGRRGVPLAPVDVAWLRMDEPTNRMHVHGILVLDGDLDLARALPVFERRLARIPRFRQRVALDGGRLVWADDEEFEIGRHVVEERLPEPGGDPELVTAVERHLASGFDRRHPLWEFRLLRGYRGADTAILGRLHHAIGDGVALMLVLLALTDLGDLPELDQALAERLGGEGANPFLDLLTAGPREAFEAARAAAGRWAPETLRLMTAPAEAYAEAGALLRGVGVTKALARILGSRNEPATPFKGELGVGKRVAWTSRLPLDEVKSAGAALGGTVNDVLNNAMAGGLRRYLAENGGADERLGFRCAMPVSLRPLDEMAALGNRFGLVFLDLPVGISDPLRRLELLRRNTARLKRSAEPVLILGLLALAGRSPQAFQDLLVRIFGAKATAVFTNVPGPSTRLTVAGHPIRDLFFWVPQAGRLGLGVSILSYDGGVRMGVMTDAGLVPDPERIVDGFHAEWERLLTAAASR